MKKLLLLLSAFSFFAVNAQDSTSYDEDEVIVGDFLLLLQVGVPSKEMKKAIRNNMGDLGFGGSLLYVSNPFTWGKNKRNSPIRIGAELGYSYYGRFITDVNINGYKGDFKTSYGILNLNAVFRIRPPQRMKLTPFLDVFAGGDFYFSSTRENLNALESGLGIEKIDLGGTSSASFNKGAGVGFMIKARKADNPGISFRITHHWGDKIKYVERNSLQYDPSMNAVTYIRGKAPVRFFLIQAGIGL